MNKWISLVGLTLAAMCFGCNSDIVTTPRLRQLDRKCVYIEPIQSEDPHVGEVLKGVIEKEFIRRGIPLCDAETATVLITGSTFMTTRGSSSGNMFGTSSTSAQCCESVSIVAKDREGNVLLSASYDNKDRATVSDFGRNFGAALAAKFR